jgi:hypothetical protein
MAELFSIFDEYSLMKKLNFIHVLVVQATWSMIAL